MGVILCKCYAQSCDNGCLPEGFALIRMTPTEDCPPTTFYDTISGKSYPWLATFKAPIGEDGCWRSCELPFSDQMHPAIHYEVIDIVAGACGDDCGCDAALNCGCPVPCVDELPTCSVWLNSETDYSSLETEEGCIPVELLCGAEPPLGHLTCKYPKCVGVTFSDLCLHDQDEGGLGVWFAPHDGQFSVQYASIPANTTPADGDTFFALIDPLTGSQYWSGVLPSGESFIQINETFPLAESEQVALQVLDPMPATPPSILNLQAEFAYCP